MNYELFLERCKEKFPNDENLDSIVKRFGEVFADEDFSDSTRIVDLFASNGKLSKAHFFRQKRYVKELYAWLYEQGKATLEQKTYVDDLTMSELVSEIEISQSYYASLDDVLDYIKLVGLRIGLGNEDDLLLQKSIAILSWHGLRRADMIAVRKEHLVGQNTLVVGEERIVLESKFYDILTRLRDASIYRGFPKGHITTYSPSPYLIRTKRRIQLNENALSSTVSSFNNVAEEYFARQLSTTALRNNGVFYRLMQSSADVASGLKQMLDCDDWAAVTWYKVLYTRWKEFYYPERGGAE